MRELELNSENFHKNKTEIQVQKKQQIERELIGQIIPHNGHKIWEINLETEEIKEATYIQKTMYLFGNFEQNKNHEVLYNKGYAYVSALNKKNAMKKFRKGKNGSKEASENPMKINLF